MKQVLAGVAFASVVFSLGCGSDTRASQIESVLTILEALASDLSDVRKRINDEIAKDKAMDADSLKGLLESIDNVKKRGKELNDKHHQILGDKEKKPPTPDEIKGYATKYRARAESAMESLDKETRELNEAIARADKSSKLKPAMDDIKKKLKDAQAEFQQILRQR